MTSSENIGCNILPETEYKVVNPVSRHFADYRSVQGSFRLLGGKKSLEHKTEQGERAWCPAERPTRGQGAALPVQFTVTRSGALFTEHSRHTERVICVANCT